MSEEQYNIEDGDDPLKQFLDVDISKMSATELSEHLAKLNEASENPRAVKRIVERKPRATKTISLDKLMEL